MMEFGPEVVVTCVSFGTATRHRGAKRKLARQAAAGAESGMAAGRFEGARDNATDQYAFLIVRYSFGLSGAHATHANYLHAVYFL